MDLSLTEFLLEKGYEVHGIKRRASSFNTQRIDHIYQDPHVDNKNFIIQSLGWQASISLESGLAMTYDWFIANQR